MIELSAMHKHLIAKIAAAENELGETANDARKSQLTCMSFGKLVEEAQLAMHTVMLRQQN